ncbi:MAG: hypothetical protein OEU90_12960 [Gammaproteobacteria bacterium]|nr:hypothetical protein [Gammaproteobacteria bacterium]MDH3806365.1 hypothetical protein [Gammaproteobacteria bacterium]
MLKTNLNLAAVILLSGFTFSALAADDPLFQSDESLALILELPPRNQLPPPQDKPTVAGLLRYTSNDGTDMVLDVAVSTRGNSRLELCSLPPLSINLKRKQVASTLFAEQNKLKIVTQCRKSAAYRRYLNQEFMVYKIHNILSEYSFRVRKLEITYRKSSGGEPDELHSAFVIESAERAAARLGMKTIKVDSVKASQLDTYQLSIYALFQFMIGNTDWSVRKGPANEECCHNGKVIAPPDSNNGWVILPYDFDQAGIINTRYATPSDLLPIKSVRQRLYRGFCSSNDQLDSTIAGFNDSRAAIEGFFDGGHDGPSPNKAALRYLRDFYEIVNDPKKRQKKVVDACQHTAN